LNYNSHHQIGREEKGRRSQRTRTRKQDQNQRVNQLQGKTRASEEGRQNQSQESNETRSLAKNFFLIYTISLFLSVSFWVAIFVTDLKEYFANEWIDEYCYSCENHVQLKYYSWVVQLNIILGWWSLNWLVVLTDLSLDDWFQVMYF